MVKLLSSVLLAAGLAVSACAGAATYNLGTLPTGVTSFGPESVASGLFSDTIDFTLTSASKLSGGLGALNFSLGGTPFFNITGLNLALYNSNHVELASGTDISLSKIAAGNYYAVITGRANGVAGGEYAGAFSVSAVPEASTWVMLLAGLGLLGYTTSRRRV